MNEFYCMNVIMNVILKKTKQIKIMAIATKHLIKYE
jgi:hypothetical protein